jgi:hypothetical protein
MTFRAGPLAALAVLAVCPLAACSSVASASHAAPASTASAAATAAPVSLAPVTLPAGSADGCKSAIAQDGYSALSSPACFGVPYAEVSDALASWDATPPEQSTSAAAPPSSPAPETVTFEVTGSYAQVTYGPAGSNASGTVPMKVTQKLGNPIYYALTAQLQGGGTVTCKIEVDGKVISQATASGGYNIAQCEISPDPINGGWEDTNGG